MRAIFVTVFLIMSISAFASQNSPHSARSPVSRILGTWEATNLICRHMDYPEPDGVPPQKATMEITRGADKKLNLVIHFFRDNQDHPFALTPMTYEPKSDGTFDLLVFRGLDALDWNTDANGNLNVGSFSFDDKNPAQLYLAPDARKWVNFCQGSVNNRVFQTIVFSKVN
jgi:hypothetical protein